MGRRWRKDSVFGEGLRVPLHREARARFKFLARTYRWNGQLTPLFHEVAQALLRRLSRDGQCDPSHARIAEDAACSERTVRRALGKLKDLGLVHWVQRIIRDGCLVSQTSNSYELRVDFRIFHGGHTDRGTVSLRINNYSQKLPKRTEEADMVRLGQVSVVGDLLLGRLQTMSRRFST